MLFRSSRMKMHVYYSMEMQSKFICAYQFITVITESGQGKEWNWALSGWKNLISRGGGLTRCHGVLDLGLNLSRSIPLRSILFSWMNIKYDINKLYFFTLDVDLKHLATIAWGIASQALRSVFPDCIIL